MEAGAGLHDSGRRASAVQIAAVLVAAVLVGTAVAVGSHLLAAKPAPPASSTSVALHGEATWAAGVRPAPAITTLADQTGHRFSLASLHGRTVAMVFFDVFQCLRAQF